MSNHNQEQSLLEKLRTLPPEKIAEVEDFVDFLYQRTQKEVAVDEQNREQQFQQRLFELGLITEVKPPITDFTPYQNRQPVEVQDKPTSQVIIEDRG